MQWKVGKVRITKVVELETVGSTRFILPLASNEEIQKLPWPMLSAAQTDITKWLNAGPRIHNVAGQYPLHETAQAHLAVEKGDKLGTVIVDCAK